LPNAKYNAAAVNAEQARVIHQAFRQAGVLDGPALNSAVRAAGFDPDKLRDLAPPPDRADGQQERPPKTEEDGPRDSALNDADQPQTGGHLRSAGGTANSTERCRGCMRPPFPMRIGR